VSDPLYFSIITSTRPESVGKAYTLDKDGKLVKTVVASISAGTAVTIAATAENLVEALKRTTESTNQVLALDSFIAAEPGSGPITIVTEKRLKKLIGGDIVAPQPGEAGFFTVNGAAVSSRLKRLMSGSGWLLADGDNPPGMPVALVKLSLAERLKLLDKILPGISTCLRIEYRGSSARVVNGSGAQAPGPTHALIQISNPELLDCLRAYVHVETVLRGLSFKAPRYSKTAPGKVTAYADLTVIDLAVWVLGRLVFNAKPVVAQAPGYRALDADVRVVNPAGGVLDISWITAPDVAQVASYAAKTNRNVQIDESNGSAFALREDGALQLTTEIEARGVVKPLAEWLALMYDRDVVKMRCEAAFRQSVSEAALIRIGGDGSIFLFDSGTSTKHYLAPLPRSEEEATAQCPSFEWYELALEVIEARDRRSLRQAQASFSGSAGQANPGPQTGPTPTPKPKPKAGQWPDPQPLEGGLPAVDAFDLELLPASIWPWIDDAATRMQCPPDYLGTTAMIALGSTLGRRIAIGPTRFGDWFEVPNLWGLVAGPPGWMKSPAMAAALKPLMRLELRAQELNAFARSAYERAMRDYKRREAAAEKKIAAALKKDINAVIEDLIDTARPELTLPRAYVFGNASYEKLGEHSANNPFGYLVHRDEIMSLLRYLASEDRSEARGFFLEAWAGHNAYRFSRVGRGEIYIPHLSFSLLGSTQPGVLSAFVSESMRDGANDGMLQRFGMMIWPDGAEDFEIVDRPIDAAKRERAYQVFERLDQIDPEGGGALTSPECDIPYLQFTPEALEAFKAWRVPFEKGLRSGKLGSPALESHFAKYRKLVPVLALIRGPSAASGSAGPCCS
jgi:hypothetical protein